MARRARELAPETSMTCDRYGCTMAVRHCLERQAARWPGGNRWKSGAVKSKRAPIYDWCGSGRCEQGGQIAALCAWRPESTWSKGRYRFFADSVPVQRQRMRALDLEDPRLLGDRPPPQRDLFALLDDLRAPDETTAVESSTY